MKTTLLSILSLCIASVSFAQQTTVTWDFEGESRKYIQYVPASYNPSEAVPLVIALHGLGDNINNFQGVGFQAVADTANFIVVYPEALEFVFQGVFSVGTAWNSGAGIDLGGNAIYPNETIDDVGYIGAIMDTLIANYNIDETRIFVTGFSMGGFMTNRLACELNNRVAAAASVAGTIGAGITCNAGASIPMCHFHGLADANVGYGTPEGTQDNTFGLNVVDWISYWNTNNGCGAVTLEGQFPDIANDGYIVDYLEYGACDNNSRVVHYKVYDADHIWMGPNDDIFYTTEIWKFFIGQSPSNLVPSAVEENEIKTIGVYPNPTADVLNLENLETGILNVSIFNSTGQIVKEFSAVRNTIDVAELEKGVYQLMVATEVGIYSNSFVKE